MKKYIEFFLMVCLMPMTVHAVEVAPREIFQVTLEDAEQAISDALVKDGAAEKVKAHLIAQRSRIMYQYPRPIALEIKTLRYDAQSRKWDANLLFTSDGQVLTAIPVGGRYDEMVEVPVLRQRLMSGEVIEKDDIEWAEIASSRLRKDFFQVDGDMIGKTPKRAVSPGRPVYSHELVAPKVIKKGQSVTMSFMTPSMEIRTTGQTMDDGALGEKIRVKNMESEKIVSAVVEDANTVRITPEG